MATAQMPQSPNPGRAQSRALRQPPFQRDDVLTLEELALGLRCSVSQIYRVAPKLKVSYLLGEQSPRVVWGDVVDMIRRTSEN